VKQVRADRFRHLAALAWAGTASVAALAGWCGILMATGGATRGWSILVAHAGNGWVAHTLLFYLLFLFVVTRRGCVDGRR
jgi:hypothetical protein